MCEAKNIGICRNLPNPGMDNSKKSEKWAQVMMK